MTKFKQIGILFSLVIIIACSDNSSKISDEIMKDIFIGEFGYLQGAGGTVLHDSKFRITDRVLEHIVAEQNKPYDVTIDRFKYQQMMFDLPQNVKAFEYLDSWDNPNNKMLKIENLSQEHYNKNDYLEAIYKGYENFKSETIKKCETTSDCEYNEKEEYIKYFEIVPEKRFKYRVETITDIIKVTICMYQINDEWQVGAILKEDL